MFRCPGRLVRIQHDIINVLLSPHGETFVSRCRAIASVLEPFMFCPR